MSKRFFVESLIESDRALLTDNEARHLSKVMRISVGEQVTLFDGSGAEFTASVARIGRNDVELSVISRQEVDRESPVTVILGVALPKGDRQRMLIEKAVELGVARVVPLITRRGVAQPVKGALDRLRRAVLEASKQCGRNRLMEIAEPQKLGDFLARQPNSAVRLLAHPDPDAPNIHNIECESDAEVFVAVGPEGGFSEEEVEAAKEWTKVNLGSRILRIETAAIAAASILAR